MKMRMTTTMTVTILRRMELDFRLVVVVIVISVIAVTVASGIRLIFVALTDCAGGHSGTGLSLNPLRDGLCHRRSIEGKMT